MSVPSEEDPHVRTLLGAYVLGALDAEEDQRVAVHLQECDACSADYLEIAEAPSLLAMFTEADLLEGLSPFDGEDNRDGSGEG